MPSLFLASGSPRRAELLRQMGVEFRQFGVDIDESPLSGENADAFVRRMAVEKARAGVVEAQRRFTDANALVLAADTIVVADNNILGKPRSQAHAAQMLRLLSGRSHQVLTSVSLSSIAAFEQEALTVSTEVRFKVLDDQEIAAYWHTGEPRDKAGGYGIQGIGAVLVAHISGSYSNVVGLPMYETAALLQAQGVSTALKKGRSWRAENNS